MNRSPIVLSMLLQCAVLGAQDGLTDDFSRLGAKERARLARAEEKAAAADTGFQGVMAQAEDLFRARRYDDAMARYEQARALRPLNVYPKVKMEDLRVLIARRDSIRLAEQATVAPAPAPPAPVEPPVVPVAPAPETPAVAPVATAAEDVPVYDTAVPASRPVPPPRPAPPPNVRPAPGAHADRHAEVGADLPDGTTERTLRTGRAIVLERVRVVGGHATVWRKVVHPWGEVVHFRDGQPVSALRWWSEFGDK